MKLERLIEGRQGERRDLTSQKHLLEVAPPINQAADLAQMSQPTYSKAKYIAEHAEEKDFQDCRHGESLNDRTF